MSLTDNVNKLLGTGIQTDPYYDKSRNTPVLSDTVKRLSQTGYNYNVLDPYLSDKISFESQSSWAFVPKATANLLTKAGSAFLGGTAALLSTPVLTPSMGIQEALFNNPIQKAIEDFREESLKYNIYQNPDLKDASVFKKLTSLAYIADQGSELGGFMLSMYGPGLILKGIGFGGRSVAMLNRIAGASDETLAAGRWLGGPTNKMINGTRALLGVDTVDGVTMLGVKAMNRLDSAAAVGINSVMEAQAEGSEHYKRIYQESLRKGYNEDEASKRAGQGASIVAAANMPLLIFSNGLFEHFVLSKIGKSLDDARMSKAAREVLDSITGKSTKTIDEIVGKTTVTDLMKSSIMNTTLAGFKEGVFEEGMQTNIGQTVKPEDGIFTGAVNSLINGFANYATIGTNKELQESIVLGALMGGIVEGTAGTIINDIQQNNKERDLMRTLNTNFISSIGSITDYAKKDDDGNIIYDDKTGLPVIKDDAVKDLQENSLKLMTQGYKADTIRAKATAEAKEVQPLREAEAVIAEEQVNANFWYNTLVNMPGGEQFAKEALKDGKLAELFESRFNANNQDSRIKMSKEQKDILNEKLEKDFNYYSEIFKPLVSQRQVWDYYYRPSSKTEKEWFDDYKEKVFIDGVSTAVNRKLLEAQKTIFNENIKKNEAELETLKSEYETYLNKNEDVFSFEEVRKEYEDILNNYGVKTLKELKSLKDNEKIDKLTTDVNEKTKSQRTISDNELLDIIAKSEEVANSKKKLKDEVIKDLDNKRKEYNDKKERLETQKLYFEYGLNVEQGINYMIKEENEKKIMPSYQDFIKNWETFKKEKHDSKYGNISEENNISEKVDIVANELKQEGYTEEEIDEFKKSFKAAFISAKALDKKAKAEDVFFTLSNNLLTKLKNEDLTTEEKGFLDILIRNPNTNWRVITLRGNQKYIVATVKGKKEPYKVMLLPGIESKMLKSSINKLILGKIINAISASAIQDVEKKALIEILKNTNRSEINLKTLPKEVLDNLSSILKNINIDEVKNILSANKSNTTGLIGTLTNIEFDQEEFLQDILENDNVSINDLTTLLTITKQKPVKIAFKIDSKREGFELYKEEDGARGAARKGISPKSYANMLTEDDQDKFNTYYNEFNSVVGSMKVLGVIGRNTLISNLTPINKSKIQQRTLEEILNDSRKTLIAALKKTSQNIVNDKKISELKTLLRNRDSVEKDKKELTTLQDIIKTLTSTKSGTELALTITEEVTKKDKDINQALLKAVHAFNDYFKVNLLGTTNYNLKDILKDDFVLELFFAFLNTYEEGFSKDASKLLKEYEETLITINEGIEEVKKAKGNLEQVNLAKMAVDEYVRVLEEASIIDLKNIFEEDGSLKSITMYDWLPDVIKSELEKEKQELISEINDSIYDQVKDDLNRRIAAEKDKLANNVLDIRTKLSDIVETTTTNNENNIQNIIDEVNSFKDNLQTMFADQDELVLEKLQIAKDIKELSSEIEKDLNNIEIAGYEEVLTAVNKIKASLVSETVDELVVLESLELLVKKNVKILNGETIKEFDLRISKNFDTLIAYKVDFTSKVDTLKTNGNALKKQNTLIALFDVFDNANEVLTNTRNLLFNETEEIMKELDKRKKGAVIDENFTKLKELLGDSVDKIIESYVAEMNSVLNELDAIYKDYEKLARNEEVAKIEDVVKFVEKIRSVDTFDSLIDVFYNRNRQEDLDIVEDPENAIKEFENLERNLSNLLHEVHEKYAAVQRSVQYTIYGTEISDANDTDAKLLFKYKQNNNTIKSVELLFPKELADFIKSLPEKLNTNTISDALLEYGRLVIAADYLRLKPKLSIGEKQMLSIVDNIQKNLSKDDINNLNELIEKVEINVNNVKEGYRKTAQTILSNIRSLRANKIAYSLEAFKYYDIYNETRKNFAILANTLKGTSAEADAIEVGQEMERFGISLETSDITINGSGHILNFGKPIEVKDGLYTRPVLAGYDDVSFEELKEHVNTNSSQGVPPIEGVKKFSDKKNILEAGKEQLENFYTKELSDDEINDIKDNSTLVNAIDTMEVNRWTEATNDAEIVKMFHKRGIIVLQTLTFNKLNELHPSIANYLLNKLKLLKAIFGENSERVTGLEEFINNKNVIMIPINAETGLPIFKTSNIDNILGNTIGKPVFAFRPLTKTFYKKSKVENIVSNKASSIANSLMSEAFGDSWVGTVQPLSLSELQLRRDIAVQDRFGGSLQRPSVSLMKTKDKKNIFVIKLRTVAIKNNSSLKIENKEEIVIPAGDLTGFDTKESIEQLIKSIETHILSGLHEHQSNDLVNRELSYLPLSGITKGIFNKQRNASGNIAYEKLTDKQKENITLSIIGNDRQESGIAFGYSSGDVVANIAGEAVPLIPALWKDDDDMHNKAMDYLLAGLMSIKSTKINTSIELPTGMFIPFNDINGDAKNIHAIPVHRTIAKPGEDNKRSLDLMSFMFNFGKRKKSNFYMFFASTKEGNAIVFKNGKEENRILLSDLINDNGELESFTKLRQRLINESKLSGTSRLGTLQNLQALFELVGTYKQNISRNWLENIDKNENVVIPSASIVNGIIKGFSFHLKKGSYHNHFANRLRTTKPVKNYPGRVQRNLIYLPTPFQTIKEASDNSFAYTPSQAADIRAAARASEKAKREVEANSRSKKNKSVSEATNNNVIKLKNFKDYKTVSGSNIFLDTPIKNARGEKIVFNNFNDFVNLIKHAVGLKDGVGNKVMEEYLSKDVVSWLTEKLLAISTIDKTGIKLNITYKELFKLLGINNIEGFLKENTEKSSIFIAHLKNKMQLFMFAADFEKNLNKTVTINFSEALVFKDTVKKIEEALNPKDSTYIEELTTIFARHLLKVSLFATTIADEKSENMANKHDIAFAVLDTSVDYMYKVYLNEILDKDLKLTDEELNKKVLDKVNQFNKFLVEQKNKNTLFSEARQITFDKAEEKENNNNQPTLLERLNELKNKIVANVNEAEFKDDTNTKYVELRKINAVRFSLVTDWDTLDDDTREQKLSKLESDIADELNKLNTTNITTATVTADDLINNIDNKKTAFINDNGKIKYTDETEAKLIITVLLDPVNTVDLNNLKSLADDDLIKLITEVEGVNIMPRNDQLLDNDVARDIINSGLNATQGAIGILVSTDDKLKEFLSILYDIKEKNDKNDPDININMDITKNDHNFDNENDLEKIVTNYLDVAYELYNKHYNQNASQRINKFDDFIEILVNNNELTINC